MIINKSKFYRNDIDGLRAYAVIAVVFFHFGYIPNGFLGVDIFFVISGYLITGIIYRDILVDEFSIKKFFNRRIKRIIPLVSFISLVTLIVGVETMLPDDLENLAQSVFATNMFSNNVLMLITTGNYWDVVNDYKPLMHTWSLAIEEQYYLFYPFLFILIAKVNVKLISPILIVLSIISIGLFFFTNNASYKFYLLPFRFFELSLGGLVTIALNGQTVKHRFSFILLIALLVIMCLELRMVGKDLLLFITVLITCGILTTSQKSGIFSSILLENRVVVFIGKLSFSIYMWHHVLLAFGRYFVFHEMGISDNALIMVITLLLSIGTYYLIEQPFRFKIKTKNIFWILSIVYLLTTTISLFIYFKGGILKDIPELGLTKGQGERNIHAKYNRDVYKHDRDFTTAENLKILVIGNSFARDWCNVLLESEFREYIEISYVANPYSSIYISKRLNTADVVFIIKYPKRIIEDLKIDTSKIWYVGTKNFGSNNGIYYNYSGLNYCSQRTSIDKKFITRNTKSRKEWGNKYIDLIELVIDQKQTMPVFTPDCKFISQDCRHFTKFGAKYFASLIESDPDFIMNKKDLRLLHNSSN